ncbi:unnamed protein product [Chrysoparadoxa australica]
MRPQASFSGKIQNVTGVEAPPGFATYECNGLLWTRSRISKSLWRRRYAAVDTARSTLLLFDAQGGASHMQAEVEVQGFGLHSSNFDWGHHCHHPYVVQIDSALRGHLWVGIDSLEELHKWTQAFSDCVTKGLLERSGTNEEVHRPLLQSKAQEVSLRFALGLIKAGRFAPNRGSAELNRRLRMLNLVRGDSAQVGSPSGGSRKMLYLEGDRERMRVRRLRSISMIRQGREERVRCKLPVMPFATFVCYQMCRDKSVLRPLLSEIALLFLHDPVAARPGEDQFLGDFLLEKVNALWLSAMKLIPKGKDSEDVFDDAPLPQMPARERPILKSERSLRRLLAPDPTTRQPTPRYEDNALPPAPKLNGEAENPWGYSSVFVKFARHFTAALNHLAVLYLSYRWDDVQALIKANSLAVATGTEEAPMFGASPPKKRGLALQGKSRWEMLRSHHKQDSVRRRVSKIMEGQREFETLGKLLKLAQQKSSPNGNGSARKEPESEPELTTECSGDRERLYGSRPVVLFMGGGMGAGKSCLLQEIMVSKFWAEYGQDAVVIEADRIKMAEPIFNAVAEAEKAGNDPELGQYVHNLSTSVANEALLEAVGAGRDVIMDGTLTWAEFVRQTVDMVRHSHLRKYKAGRGFHVTEGGETIESYWESKRSDDHYHAQYQSHGGANAICGYARREYKIEIVGAYCPPELAVARGIRRKIVIGRGVPVAPQLRSHRLFAQNFPLYAEIVNEITLYDTSLPDKPRVIAHMAEGRPLLIDPGPYYKFMQQSILKDQASNMEELLPAANYVQTPLCLVEKKQKERKAAQVSVDKHPQHAWTSTTPTYVMWPYSYPKSPRHPSHLP